MAVSSESRPDSQQTMTGHEDDEEYAQKGLVEARYMGTLADRRDMNALGRVQVLRVSCSSFVPVVLALLISRRETSGLSPLLDLGAV